MHPVPLIYYNTSAKSIKFSKIFSDILCDNYYSFPITKANINPTMVIAHNLLAMNAQRQYNTVTGSKKKSTEKLSSGYRINRAADDAAGLTISEKLRSQIRGLNQGSENIQDGISFVQVADGALNEIHDMLHRMTELSIKAMNGTNTAEDRESINSEVNQLRQEINTTFETTEFNSRKIWNEIGNNPIVIGTVKVPAVQYLKESSSTTLDNTNKWAAPCTSIKLTANEDGIVASWKGYNGKNYETETIPWADDVTGYHSFKIGDYIDSTKYPEAAGINAQYSYKVNDSSTKSDVITALNNTQIGVSLSTSESITQTTSGNTGISFSINTTYPVALLTDRDFTSNDNDYVTPTGSGMTINPSSGNSSDDFRFDFTLPGIGNVHTQVSSAYYYSSDSSAAGEGLWWRTNTLSNGRTYRSTITHDASPDNASLDAMIYAISNSNGESLTSDGNGSAGHYYINFNLVADTAFSTPGGGTTTNVGNMTMSVSISPSETVDSLKEKLSNLTGIDAFGYSLPRMSASTSSGPSANKVDDNEYRYDYRIEIQAGTDNDDASVIPIEYEKLNAKILGINSCTTLTHDEAADTLDRVQTALDMVSEQRSKFGAYQNRLEHAQLQNDNTSENLQAAESLLRDTDMAAEMVALSKHNILAQAGEAMIAQANQRPQAILSLLQ